MKPSFAAAGRIWSGPDGVGYPSSIIRFLHPSAPVHIFSYFCPTWPLSSIVQGALPIQALTHKDREGAVTFRPEVFTKGSDSGHMSPQPSHLLMPTFFPLPGDVLNPMTKSAIALTHSPGARIFLLWYLLWSELWSLSLLSVFVVHLSVLRLLYVSYPLPFGDRCCRCYSHRGPVLFQGSSKSGQTLKALGFGYLLRSTSIMRNHASRFFSFFFMSTSVL